MKTYRDVIIYSLRRVGWLMVTVSVFAQHLKTLVLKLYTCKTSSTVSDIAHVASLISGTFLLSEVSLLEFWGKYDRLLKSHPEGVKARI